MKNLEQYLECNKLSESVSNLYYLFNHKKCRAIIIGKKKYYEIFFNCYMQSVFFGRRVGVNFSYAIVTIATIMMMVNIH